KFLAKLASEFDKPRGFALIGKAETLDLLADKPISIIFGIGQVSAATLRRDGLHTIGQLQQMEPQDLIRRYGDTGARLARLSRGQDARTVSPDHAMKSVSCETTFNSDIATFEHLSAHLL